MDNARDLKVINGIYRRNERHSRALGLLYDHLFIANHHGPHQTPSFSPSTRSAVCKAPSIQPCAAE